MGDSPAIVLGIGGSTDDLRKLRDEMRNNAAGMQTDISQIQAQIVTEQGKAQKAMTDAEVAASKDRIQAFREEMAQKRVEIQQLREDIQKLSQQIPSIPLKVTVDQGSLDQVKGALEAPLQSLKNMAMAIPAVALGAAAFEGIEKLVDGIKEFVLGAGEAEHAMERLSEETGIPVTKLKELEVAFASSGVKIDGLARLVGIFEKQLTTGGGGAGSGLAGALDGVGIHLNRIQSSLKALGIAWESAPGQIRPFNDIMLDVADVFQKMPDGANKTAVAMQLFGYRGMTLIPILNQGREALQGMFQDADEVGTEFHEKLAKEFGEYEAQTKKVSMAWDEAKASFAEMGWIPLLTAGLEKVTHALENMKSEIDNVKAAGLSRQFIGGLGGSLLGSMIPGGAAVGALAGSAVAKSVLPENFGLEGSTGGAQMEGFVQSGMLGKDLRGFTDKGRDAANLFYAQWRQTIEEQAKNDRPLVEKLAFPLLTSDESSKLAGRIQKGPSLADMVQFRANAPAGSFVTASEEERKNSQSAASDMTGSMGQTTEQLQKLKDKLPQAAAAWKEYNAAVAAAGKAEDEAKAHPGADADNKLKEANGAVVAAGKKAQAVVANAARETAAQRAQLKDEQEMGRERTKLYDEMAQAKDAAEKTKTPSDQLVGLTARAKEDTAVISELTEILSKGNLPLAQRAAYEMALNEVTADLNKTNSEATRINKELNESLARQGIAYSEAARMLTQETGKEQHPGSLGYESSTNAARIQQDKSIIAGQQAPLDASIALGDKDRDNRAAILAAITEATKDLVGAKQEQLRIEGEFETQDKDLTELNKKYQEHVKQLQEVGRAELPLAQQYAEVSRQVAAQAEVVAKLGSAIQNERAIADSATASDDLRTAAMTALKTDYGQVDTEMQKYQSLLEKQAELQKRAADEQMNLGNVARQYMSIMSDMGVKLPKPIDDMFRMVEAMQQMRKLMQEMVDMGGLDKIFGGPNASMLHGFGDQLKMLLGFKPPPQPHLGVGGQNPIQNTGHPQTPQDYAGQAQKAAAEAQQSAATDQKSAGSTQSSAANSQGSAASAMASGVQAFAQAVSAFIQGVQQGSGGGMPGGPPGGSPGGDGSGGMQDLPLYSSGEQSNAQTGMPATTTTPPSSSPGLHAPTVGGAAQGVMGAVPGISAMAQNQSFMGDLMGGMSAGSSIGNMFGQIGGLIGGIAGSIAGLIEGIFTEAAREIATNAKNMLAATMQAYSSGVATLGQTITAIENQQVQTQQQLAGKKGGAAQLRTLNQQYDQELDQLQAQQKQIMDSFNQQLAVLQLPQAYQQTATSLQSLNNTVEQYLQAGGSAAQATQFLQQSLANLDQTMTQDVQNSMLQTINNLQQENQLQEQLTQTTAQYGQTVKGILGQGLAERDLSVGQTKAQQIATATQQYDTQMTQLQDQLAELEAQTNAQQQLFNLSKDTNALEATKVTLMTQQAALAAQQVQAEQTYLQDLQVQGTVITGGKNTALTGAIAPTLPTTTAAGVSAVAGMPMGSAALQSLAAAGGVSPTIQGNPTSSAPGSPIVTSLASAGLTSSQAMQPAGAPTVNVATINVQVPPGATPAMYADAVRQGLQKGLLDLKAVNSGVFAGGS